MKIKKLFGGFIGHLEKRGATSQTISEYRRFLYGPIYRAVGELELSSVRVIDGVEIMEEAQSHGVSAPQRAIVDFRMLLKFAKDSGYAVPVDYRDFKVPKLPRTEIEFLMTDEIDLIRNSFDMTKHEEERLLYEGGSYLVEKSKMAALRMRTFCEVLLGTGLRLSEACAIKIEDIHWSHKEIRIMNCKTKQIQKVYLTDKAIAVMEEYLRKRDDNSPYLFVSNGSPMKPSCARKYLWKLAKRIELSKHFSSRIFRKTYVTTLLLNGADMKSTQVLSRHESPVTTLRHYAGIMFEQCRETHSRLMNAV